MAGVFGIAMSLIIGGVLAILVAFTGATVIQNGSPDTIGSPLVVYGTR
jgi:hypothetical protein